MSSFNPRTSKGEGGGGGGRSTEPPIGLIGFSDLKIEAISSNQNETFSTCSLIMSATFDVN